MKIVVIKRQPWGHIPPVGSLAVPHKTFGLVCHCWATTSWSMASHTTQSCDCFLFKLQPVKIPRIPIWTC